MFCLSTAMSTARFRSLDLVLFDLRTIGKLKVWKSLIRFKI